MDRLNPFYRQAELLVRALPCVARQPEFALKGGTAINFFFRNLPRLSVDIDLTYLPLLRDGLMAQNAVRPCGLDGLRARMALWRTLRRFSP